MQGIEAEPSFWKKSDHRVEREYEKKLDANRTIIKLIYNNYYYYIIDLNTSQTHRL